jgi:thymidine kinase
VAELVYFCGTMDSGKSTLALQTAHNHQSRAGSGTISSRLGLIAPAMEVVADLDFHAFVLDLVGRGERIDFIICDEAQFYTRAQVEQLATIVDSLGIDVFAFGILTDFRTELFPGSGRLVELADRVNTLQVEALCWCGERATHNARVVNGVMVVEGEQVVIGDTDDDVISYEVLCRRHHMRQVTSRQSRDYFAQDIPLPFEGNS